jgi:cell division protein FtsL
MVMAQRKILDDEFYTYPDEETVRVGLPKQKKAVRVKRRTQAARIQGLIMMLCIIGLFGLIGAMTVHTNVVKGAEVRTLEKELQDLNVENDLLQVQVDKLSSISRIEKVALAMGMERPEGTLYIASNTIQPQKTVGVEQTQKTAAVAAAPAKGQADSAFDNVFKILTSFFASTQR